MVVCDKKLANVMGGKTARACDNCISKRATWYCPADDAFLCQSCDSSVHSANPLARRHERVRLKTASMKHLRKLSVVPSWDRGFTKKARTPRNKKHAKPMLEYASEYSSSSSSGVNVINRLDLVPELCSDDNSFEENDEQLLYRVPILVQELCNDSNWNEGVTTINNTIDESKGTQSYSIQLHGSLPSEMELEEFAADVESLLGKRLDDESFDIEGLGFSDRSKDQIENSCGSGQTQMKVEDHDHDHDHVDGDGDQIEMGIREPFEIISFDFDSSIACEDDYNSNVQLGHDFNRDICKVEEEEEGSTATISGNKILLRLDYEGVMTSWADQKSPWTTGERPELDPYCCWPLCTGGMGSCGRVDGYGNVGLMFGHPAIVDGGREARVSRYREKRRTRLFSKKIRYEVRKLNAEKRPRMKGRFVKRANLPSHNSSSNNNNNK